MSQQTQDDGGRSIDLCTENPLSPNFPRSILSVSQEEFYGQDSAHQPLELTIKEGLTEREVELPLDLQGHVFIVGPAGSVDSEECKDSKYVVKPTSDGWTSAFNGDGMIYRLDFGEGKASLSTRLVKTPCYYADAATHNNPDYGFKFRNFGLARLSLHLGFRNRLNTAFLPMRFSHQNERLLITWDVGRPYEIDPRSLALVAPVGWNQDWYSLVKMRITEAFPFPLIMTTTHPCFDPNTDEMFTVNAGKSLHTILWLSRLLIYNFEQIQEFLAKIPCKRLIKTIIQGTHIVFHKFKQFLIFLTPILRFFGFKSNDFVYLIRWDGNSVGGLQKWEVLLPNCVPIRIEQSMHQMGLTKDYIVLVDTAFKIVVEDLLPKFKNKKNWSKAAQSIARQFLSYPQLPYVNAYIVARSDLKPGVSSVKAVPVKISPEMAHFLVDYDNPDDKITLHAAYGCAADPAEFIHLIDHSIYDDPQITENLRQLAGMVPAPMDVSRLGCCVIDVKSGTYEQALVSVEESCEYTWNLAIYAYRDEMPVEQLQHIYWNSWGCWQEILSKFIFNMYKKYDNRTISVEEICDIISKGKPANLCREDIERTEEGVKLKISDNYNFPPGYFGNSPQFVPRAGKVGATEGYIVCVVLYTDNLISQSSNDALKTKDWSNNTEIWIFNAENLQQGPLYRLSHSKLNIGITVHSTWLKEIVSRPDNNYNIRLDYDPSIERHRKKSIREQMRNLFEKEVYPHFEKNHSDK